MASRRPVTRAASRKTLLVVLAVLIAAPAGARAASPASALRTPSVDPQAILSRHFTDASSFGRPETYANAERELLETVLGKRVYSLRTSPGEAPHSFRTNPVPDEEPRVAAEQGEDIRDVTRQAIPAGDFDGDGRPDVLVLNRFSDDRGSRQSTQATLAALNDEGREIWESAFTKVTLATQGPDVRGLKDWQDGARDLFDGFVIPVSDIDLDGRADVLLVEFFAQSSSESWNCVGLPDNSAAGDPCWYSASMSYEWRYSIVSGRTGSKSAPLSFTGDASVNDAGEYTWLGPFTGTQAAVVSAPAGLVLPFESDDHDGDDQRDIVLDAIDVSMVQVANGDDVNAGPGLHGYQMATALATATTASVRSGANGAELFTQEAGTHFGQPAVLLPAGNIIGDRRTDLLWQAPNNSPAYWGCFDLLAQTTECAIAEATTMDVITYDGSPSKSFETGWASSDPSQRPTDKSPVPDSPRRFLLPMHSDLDGDGHDDLQVILSRAWFEGAGVVAGSTGNALWEGWLSAPFSAIEAVPASAPGNDVLVAADWGGGTGAWAVLDGANGSTLRQGEVHLGDGGEGHLQFAEAGDTDGDGLTDVLWQWAGPAGDGFVSSDIAVTSSEDASTFFRRTQTLDFEPRAIPAGDVDGDGNADIYVVAPSEISGGVNVNVSAVDLAGGGESFWTETLFDSMPSYSFDLVPAGDLFGTGGSSAVVMRSQQTPAELSDVAAIKGTNGDEVWAYGDPTISPASAGSLYGTAAETGGDFLEGVCVTAFDASNGRRLGTTRSEVDGRFAFDRIPGGDYKLYFSDCSADQHAPVWYSDAASFNSATVVHVNAGSATSGVFQQLDRANAPVNDTLDGAIDLGSGPIFNVNTSTRAATTDDDDPAACGVGATVWYTLTPEEDMTIEIVTNGSDFDTAVAVYEATVQDATAVACNDDASADGSSKVSFDAVAGFTYYIQAGGSAGASGALRLATTLQG